MIAIIDYDVGNLRSVQKGFEAVGSSAEIVRDPHAVARADKVILPGVGAFRDAVAALRRTGMDEAVRGHIASGKPFLGICLGLQMLFEVSHEDGQHRGLGVLGGEVVRFPPAAPDGSVLKVPHMGWNRLLFEPGRCRLLDGVEPGSHVYFVHSYHPVPTDRSVIAAEADYGGRFCCAVSRGNVHAVQFHPEKSQSVGLRMLANFAAM
jgi:glutamine amidotransferase